MTHIKEMTLALEEFKHIKQWCLRSIGIGLVNENVLAALEEALAKQEQGEPVAWVNPDDLYDLEAGEDGDVPYVVRGNEQPKNMPKSIPLYTTQQPAQKPWVGLTYEEIRACIASNKYAFEIVRAAEAKLKEKNT